MAMIRHFVLSVVQHEQCLDELVEHEVLLMCASLFLEKERDNENLQAVLEAPTFVGTPSVRSNRDVAMYGRQGKRGAGGPRPKKMPRDITYTYVPYKRQGKKMDKKR